MALKIDGTPAVRRMVIDRLLAHYVEQGILANAVFDKHSGRYLMLAPTGEQFVYGLMQMEAWITGLQTFALRLGMGPLTLSSEEQKPGTCEEAFCESAMKAAMWETEYEQLKERYDALAAQEESGVAF